MILEIAHGIIGRKDLPIPDWLFGWAAAVVLVVSFVALAVLWSEPRLEDGGFRALPRHSRGCCSADRCRSPAAPWESSSSAVAWVAQTAARAPLPAPFRYPARLGRWPAVVGLFAFAALEPVISEGRQPENVAIATLVYSAATSVAMALYGVEA